MSATRLHLTAFDGDQETVIRLLGGGADPNGRTDDGETPLLFAAGQGHVDIVRALLGRGAEVNALPSAGSSALRRAIHGGHAECVRLLLAHGADPEAVVPVTPPTPQELGAIREQVRKAVEKKQAIIASFGIDPATVSDEIDGILPRAGDKPMPPPKAESGVHRCLSMAITAQSIDTLRVLLEAGLSPNTKSDRESVLSLLSLVRPMGSGVEMGRLLLQYGANPNGEDDHIISGPLGMAVLSGDLPFARLLIDAGASTEGPHPSIGLLALAIQQDDFEMATFLADRGIGLNDRIVDTFLESKDPKFRELIEARRGTSWLTLVRNGDVAGVRAALQSGVDTKARDKRGGSALHVAVKHADAAMVAVLLAAGLNSSQPNEHGFTPLYDASSKGATDMVKLLIAAGADVNAQSKMGQTPLHAAARNGHGDSADLLMAAGARLNVVEAILLKRMDAAHDFWERGIPVDWANEAGMTALHAAARIGDPRIVKDLLDRGAKIDAQDLAKRAPTIYAVESESLEALRILLDYGATLSGSGSKFTVPVVRAVSMWHEPMVRLLLERGSQLKQELSEDAVRRVKDTAPSVGAAIAVLERMKDTSTLLSDALMTISAVRSSKSTEVPEKWRRPERFWSVLKTLMEFGVDANGTDANGRPLLSVLIEFDAPEDLIRYSVERGAKVNPTHDSRDVPLLLAVNKGRADVVAVLLAAGADPNAGMASRSPLQAARERNLPEIEQLLLARGASDVRREAAIADLGDTAKLFFQDMPTMDVNEIPKAFRTNIGALMENLKSRQAANKVERRARLEVEVVRGES